MIMCVHPRIDLLTKPHTPFFLQRTKNNRTSDVFDSKDFNLNAAPTEANLATAVTAFSASLTTYGANPGAKGIITLEHDLYQVTVDFAKRILPVATSAKLKIQS